jgi:hypothetical protein
MKKNDAAGEGMSSSRRTPRTDVTDLDQTPPERRPIFRHWVEIRDLRDGSVRTLPVHAMTLVPLGGRPGDTPEPAEQLLRLQDDITVFEATDFEELAEQLRSRYPDQTHERHLHRERDPEAEQRQAAAMRSLVELLVEATVKDVLRQHDAGQHPAAGT